MTEEVADWFRSADAIFTLVDGTRKMTLNYSDGNDTLRRKLNELSDQNYYENIFSWDMGKETTDLKEMSIGFNQTLDKIRETLLQKELALATYKCGRELFNLHKFYLKLLVCYVLYADEKYVESLSEVEDIVKYMKIITFENEQYIDAYKHILLSTYAFISTFLNINNYEEIMKDVKLQSELNDTEKSAIHAVKALIFMKYPSSRKHIAFLEADKAYKLNNLEPEWMKIWLTAKDQFNKEYNRFEEPEDDELKIAEHLLGISQSFWHLIAVSDVFLKVYKYTNDEQKKEKYFELTSKNMSIAIELAGSNKNLIMKCLKRVIDQPRLLLSKSIITKKIKIFQHFEDPRIYSIFGDYFLNHEKDFKKAKDCFIRGKETDVSCVLKMLKVECILKPQNTVPVIETLIEAYETFPIHKKDRIKLLSQILLYYTYCEVEHDKIIHYFKLFMNQPFNNAFKYRHLITVIPIFEIKNFYSNQFVENLFNKMENVIKNYKCKSKKKNKLHYTLESFFKMVMEQSNNPDSKRLVLLYHLNVNVWTKLNDIINNYESIFSWKIKKLAGEKNNLMMKSINDIEDKINDILTDENEFSEKRFCLKLVQTIIWYTRKEYKESFYSVQDIIKYIESMKFNEKNKKYINAYEHIALSSLAFISIILPMDFKMEDIKPVDSLNLAENSAICAVKANVFMEFPPKGNEVALKFAEQACNLESTEPQWEAVYLKAKGCVRRYYNPFSLPDPCELSIAEKFSLCKTAPLLWIQAAQVYSEATNYTMTNNLLQKVIDSAEYDIECLSLCLLEYLKFPSNKQPKQLIDHLINKLPNVKNSVLDPAIGKYYVENNRNEEAKKYLGRSLYIDFECALLLLKIYFED